MVTRPMKIRFLIASFTAMAVGCGGADGPGTPTGPSAPLLPVVAIAVSCSPQGATQQCSAMARLENDSTENITGRATWTSSNTSVATVSPSGLVAHLASGEALITAEYQGVSGGVQITVSVTVTTVAVSCTPEVAAHRCGATAHLSNGTTQDVTTLATWTSMNTGVATVAAGGRVTHLSPGKAEIRASFQRAAGGVTIDVTVSVTAVSVMCEAESGAHQCSAIATLSVEATRDVTSTATWASSNTAVAAIDSRGRVTHKSGGTSEITATYAGVTGRAMITIIALSSVSVTCTPAPGEHQCAARATFSDGSSENVTSQATWLSTNTRIAMVDASGRVTHLDSGTTEIRATHRGLTGAVTLSIVVPLTGTGVVINELASRRGDYTAMGDFVELRNDSSHPVDIGGWRLMTSPGPYLWVTFPGGLTLSPGCHFLIAATDAELVADIRTSPGLGDTGGVALVRPDGSIADQVGMSEQSIYREGSALPKFAETSGAYRSYSRVGADTNDNLSDFVFGPASPMTQSGSCAVR